MAPDLLSLRVKKSGDTEDEYIIQWLLKVVLDSCSTSTVTTLKPPPSESDVAGAIDAIKLCSTQYPVLEHR